MSRLNKIKGGWLKGVVGIVVLVGLMAWSGGCFKNRLAPGELAVEEGRPVPDGAKTVVAEQVEWRPRIDLVGTAASGERVNLSSRIPAYVKEVFVSAGDEVTRGQVLLTLDDRELQEQLAAAEAGLKQAKTEYERTRKLIEANAATDQALTAVQSAYDAARAQVEQIKVMLSYTQIRSPLDGKVTDRRIEVGDLANPGQVLLAVYDPAQMRMEVAAPLRLVDKLQRGTQVAVAMDRPRQTLSGKVAEVESEVDAASRTQMVKIDLVGDTGAVLPGMFGRVHVFEDPRPAIIVPESAVYRVGQLAMVRVVEPNGRWKRRLIRTGDWRDDKIEVLSGLQGGETLLLSPQC